jgi:hypothetical protein
MTDFDDPNAARIDAIRRDTERFRRRCRAFGLAWFVACDLFTGWAIVSRLGQPWWAGLLGMLGLGGVMAIVDELVPLEDDRR